LERAIQVIRVFDHKRVVVAGDEIDENLVVLECAHVSGIEREAASLLARISAARDKRNEPRMQWRWQRICVDNARSIVSAGGC
jgi:hypothetical protein